MLAFWQQAPQHSCSPCRLLWCRSRTVLLLRSAGFLRRMTSAAFGVPVSAGAAPWVPGSVRVCVPLSVPVPVPVSISLAVADSVAVPVTISIPLSTPASPAVGHGPCCSNGVVELVDRRDLLGPICYRVFLVAFWTWRRAQLCAAQQVDGNTHSDLALGEARMACLATRNNETKPARHSPYCRALPCRGPFIVCAHGDTPGASGDWQTRPELVHRPVAVQAKQSRLWLAGRPPPVDEAVQQREWPTPLSHRWPNTSLYGFPSCTGRICKHETRHSRQVCAPGLSRRSVSGEDQHYHPLHVRQV